MSQYGRAAAITGFRDALLSDQKLYDSLWTLSGRRLVCHCRPSEKCHGDVLIEEFRNTFPDAYDRAAGHGAPPEPGVLSFMARLREEPEGDEGSSSDEEVPGKSSGHRGRGGLTKVGVGCTQSDGQSLASPGRWKPFSRVYPSTKSWNLAADCYRRFTSHHGTEHLLVLLAMGKGR